MSIKISPKMPDCSTKRWDCPASKCESCHQRNIDPEKGKKRKKKEKSMIMLVIHKGQICAIKIHKAWKWNIKTRNGMKGFVRKSKTQSGFGWAVLHFMFDGKFSLLRSTWKCRRQQQRNFRSSKNLLTFWKFFCFCVK